MLVNNLAPLTCNKTGPEGCPATDLRRSNLEFWYLAIFLSREREFKSDFSELRSDQKQTKFATIKSDAGISLHKFEKAAKKFDSKKMILKVMFQKSSKKLLFAEAEEDFVEFLFSLLIIPLGIVEWLLGSNTCLNNIDNLYRSIADLIGKKYLKGANAKDSLIKPWVNSVYSDNCFLHLSEASLSRASHLGRKRVLVAGSRCYGNGEKDTILVP
ncbi:hypothetical protein ACS0TY_030242 [Phlomoides rotata]